MRRRSKHTRKPRPLLVGQNISRRVVAGRSFLIRAIRIGQSEKEYRCPGCNQIVAKGIAHVVVWPEEPPIGMQSGLELRRHWHSYCWERA